MRGLTMLVLAGLLSTALLASTATALPVPDPTQCKAVTDINCLLYQVCNPVSGYSCVPGVPIRCTPTDPASCVQADVNCYTLGAVSKVVDLRFFGGTCLEAACQAINPLSASCTASEILCEDVTPLYQQVAVPIAGGVANDLLGLLGGTPAVGPTSILRNVLVRAAFYCEPPEGGPGSVGQGCQEVITTDPGRIGLRDFLFHDLAPGAPASVKGLDCAWLSSNASGWLYLATDGWTKNFVDFDAVDSDCATVVRLGLVESGLGIGSHAESFRFVYC